MIPAPPNEERTRWLAHRQALDVTRPQQWLIEHERSESGEILPTATLFLTNRECPWRCLYCDLWKSTTTATVPPGTVPAQIDFALHQLGRDELRESQSSEMGARVAHPSNEQQIKLYNAGSFFDPKAIPPDDHEAIAALVRDFARVIVECHPALVGESAVRFRNLLNGGGGHRHDAIKFEVAMGLEVADDALLAKMNKRMTLTMFRHAAEFLLREGIAVRAFVIIKPPFVRTDAEAIELARRSIDFAFDCGASVVSLIPARFGPVELDALARAGEFSPPALDTVEEAVDYGIAQQRGRVFADLWDIERLCDCARRQPDRIARLRDMNLTQVVLPRIPCTREAVVSPVST